MKGFNEFKHGETYSFFLQELVEYDFSTLPPSVELTLDGDEIDNYDDLPVTSITRVDNLLSLSVSRMLYSEEYWNHKYTPLTFVKAIIQAIELLRNEGVEILDADYSDDGAENGICVWWNIKLSSDSKIGDIRNAINSSMQLIFNKAMTVLDGLNSVLILGKDTGEYLEKLQRIAAYISSKGFNPIIIKEKEDIDGETVIQKMLRYALQSKFILVENTEPSGHLFEIGKIEMTGKVMALFQQEGKGATFVFEDHYNQNNRIMKFYYTEDNLKDKINEAETWCNEVYKELSEYQKKNLPWYQKQ